jgi:hypothetical protein
MALVHRHFLGSFKGRITYNLIGELGWNKKTILVTASEGHDQQFGSLDDPHRFVGDAAIIVENVAPMDGGLSARFNVDYHDPVPVWVDVRVFEDDVSNDDPLIRVPG